MKPRQLFAILSIVLLLAAVMWYVNSGKKISRPTSSAATPEVIDGIGVEGTGGDPLLNIQKNRFAPPDTLTDISVTQLRAISSSVLLDGGRRRRSSWNGSAYRYVNAQEHRGLRIAGYLIHAKESGPESCNGYSDSLRDYHLWLSDAPTDEKSSGVVVEITPRWKRVHPEWRLHTFERLAQAHAHVRISGWLMWDEEHPDEVGKSRGSQWEIHPVTNFEVEGVGGWQSLRSP